MSISALGLWMIVGMFIVLIYDNFTLRLKYNDLFKVVNNNAAILDQLVQDYYYTQDEDEQDNSDKTIDNTKEE